MLEAHRRWDGGVERFVLLVFIVALYRTIHRERQSVYLYVRGAPQVGRRRGYVSFVVFGVAQYIELYIERDRGYTYM